MMTIDEQVLKLGSTQPEVATDSATVGLTELIAPPVGRDGARGNWRLGSTVRGLIMIQRKMWQQSTLGFEVVVAPAD